MQQAHNQQVAQNVLRVQEPTCLQQEQQHVLLTARQEQKKMVQNAFHVKQAQPQQPMQMHVLRVLMMLGYF